MNRRARAVFAWGSAMTVCAVVIVARHQPPPTGDTRPPPPPGYVYEDEPDPTTGPTTTAAVTATTAAPTTTVATTTTTAAATTTTVPAALDPDVAAVTAVAVGFLHGWTLRGTWDQRAAALTPYTTPDYRVAVAYTDPDLVGLPPGTSITVDPAAIVLGSAGSATVPANVDGLAVTVHEVRAGTAWLVDQHG